MITPVQPVHQDRRRTPHGAASAIPSAWVMFGIRFWSFKAKQPTSDANGRRF